MRTDSYTMVKHDARSKYDETSPCMLTACAQALHISVKCGKSFAAKGGRLVKGCITPLCLKSRGFVV
jgi:hypothetical protein